MQLLDIMVISFLTQFLASSFETPANFPWLLTVSLLSTFKPKLILYLCFSITDKILPKAAFIYMYITLDWLGSQPLSITEAAD